MDFVLVATLLVSTFFCFGRWSTLARLVRPLRPHLSLLLIVGWTLLRVFSDRQPKLSLLRISLDYLGRAHNALCAALAPREHLSSKLGQWMVRLIHWLWLLMEDSMAWILFCAVSRRIYMAYHYSFDEWTDLIIKRLFEWARDTVPIFRAEIDRQTQTFAQTADQVLSKDPNRELLLSLPRTGRPAKDIVEELEKTAAKEDEKWTEGKASGIVYNDDRRHTELMHAVYKAYSSGNPLHPGFWPKLNQCEAEVIAITADLLHAPQSNGAMTSGGTESIILAIRAHQVYYGRRRGIHHPEIICSSSAHAAVNKACEMFGIRLVVINCNDGKTFQLKPSLVRKRITSNTIMIYASAPSYPQGVIDPIAGLSDLALEFGIGLHVDACLGGFVLAFLKDAPVFDFRHVGVTSMSADTHKYGYAAKGTSVVLYRHKELRHCQYFCYPHWSGGMYATPTIAGSRPGALTACAWASLVSLGREGFEGRAIRIVEAARVIAHGVLKIPGLKLMTPKPSMVVCFGSDEVDIYRVLDSMEASGWTLNSLQNPPCVHVCVTLPMTTKVSVFLRDLQTAVMHVRKEGKAGKSKGTAGIYGAVGALPDGPVECVLQTFVDMTLAP